MELFNTEKWNKFLLFFKNNTQTKQLFTSFTITNTTIFFFFNLLANLQNFLFPLTRRKIKINKTSKKKNIENICIKNTTLHRICLNKKESIIKFLIACLLDGLGN